MPAFERISSGYGTLVFVGVIWSDSYSPRTQALLGLAVVRRIVSTSIELLQSGRIQTTQTTYGKHEKVRFLSCPKDRSTLYFQLSLLFRFFAFLANCFGVL